MAVKKVLRMGTPSLLRVSEPVRELDTPDLHQLIEDMQDTMQAMNGAGLAAPQIGVNLRVVIFGSRDNPRYPDREPVPDTVLVNPLITPLGEERDFDWEGCLSLPGMRGYVPRFKHVQYQGFSPDGQRIDRRVSGFHARVVQHECDHLDGVLYPMRVEDLRKFGYEEELFNDKEI